MTTPDIEAQPWPTPEVVEHIAERIHSHPQGYEPTWKPPKARRVSRIVTAIDAVPDARGGLGLAAFATIHADAPTVLMRSGFLLPPSDLKVAGLDEVEGVATQLAWGVYPHRSFVRGPLTWLVWKGESTLAAYDLDRALGLLQMRQTTTRDGRGLSLAFATTTKRKGGRSRRRGMAADRNLPGVTLRAYDGRRQRARFTSNGDGVWHPARLVDVVQLFHAQTGKYPKEVADLCSRLHLPAPTGGEGPEALAARAVAIARCYAALFHRHRSLVGPYGGPDDATSPGWYGRRWLEGMGLVPPLTRWWP